MDAAFIAPVAAAVTHASRVNASASISKEFYGHLQNRKSNHTTDTCDSSLIPTLQQLPRAPLLPLSYDLEATLCQQPLSVFDKHNSDTLWDSTLSFDKKKTVAGVAHDSYSTVSHSRFGPTKGALGTHVVTQSTVSPLLQHKDSCWQYREDVAGKPGWVAEGKPNSIATVHSDRSTANVE